LVTLLLVAPCYGLRAITINASDLTKLIFGGILPMWISAWLAFGVADEFCFLVGLYTMSEDSIRLKKQKSDDGFVLTVIGQDFINYEV